MTKPELNLTGLKTMGAYWLGYLSGYWVRQRGSDFAAWKHAVENARDAGATQEEIGLATAVVDGGGVVVATTGRVVIDETEADTEGDDSLEPV